MCSWSFEKMSCHAFSRVCVSFLSEKDICGICAIGLPAVGNKMALNHYGGRHHKTKPVLNPKEKPRKRNKRMLFYLNLLIWPNGGREESLPEETKQSNPNERDTTHCIIICTSIRITLHGLYTKNLYV